MRSGIASVAILVCLVWAGMNFNASGEAEFVEVNTALENAISGSDAPKCKLGPRCTSGNYYYCEVGGTGDSCICSNCK